MNTNYTTHQIDEVLDATDFFALGIATKCLGSDWAMHISDRSLKGLRVAALQRMGFDTKELTGSSR